MIASTYKSKCGICAYLHINNTVAGYRPLNSIKERSFGVYEPTDLVRLRSAVVKDPLFCRRDIRPLHSNNN